MCPGLVPGQLQDTCGVTGDGESDSRTTSFHVFGNICLRMRPVYSFFEHNISLSFSQFVKPLLDGTALKKGSACGSEKVLHRTHSQAKTPVFME